MAEVEEAPQEGRIARSMADKRAVSVAKTCGVSGTVVTGMSGAEVVAAPADGVSSSPEDITERMNKDKFQKKIRKPAAHH